MLERIVGTLILAVAAWAVVGIFYRYLDNSATIISAMIICTSIITYKIDKLRKEIQKDKDPQKDEE